LTTFRTIDSRQVEVAGVLHAPDTTFEVDPNDVEASNEARVAVRNGWAEEVAEAPKVSSKRDEKG
jgi:hypothetical protein